MPGRAASSCFLCLGPLALACPSASQASLPLPGDDHCHLATHQPPDPAHRPTCLPALPYRSRIPSSISPTVMQVLLQHRHLELQHRPPLLLLLFRALPYPLPPITSTDGSASPLPTRPLRYAGAASSLALCASASVLAPTFSGALLMLSVASTTARALLSSAVLSSSPSYHCGAPRQRQHCEHMLRQHQQRDRKHAHAGYAACPLTSSSVRSLDGPSPEPRRWVSCPSHRPL